MLLLLNHIIIFFCSLFENFTYIFFLAFVLVVLCVLDNNPSFLSALAVLGGKLKGVCVV
jgi:hypothetical protein